MKKTITIPKNISSKDDLDFEFLRKAGFDYIEKFGSKLWTDYNTHDPGITILEMLCYAITDLSQRIEMPIQNLLASETDNLNNMHKQFLSAINILPSKPVTALDYRKLFIHLKEVKNAWIVKHEQKMYINCKDETMSYTKFEGLLPNEQKDFTLKGLNDIYIDFEEDVEDEQAVLDKVKAIYMDNRNLCEDLVNVCKIPEQPISVCAYIDLEPDADEELIQAQINRALTHYLAPSVKFYTLQEMYDKKYTTDQIFEGPVVFPKTPAELQDYQGGFIDTIELKEAALRKEVRLSDIIKIIMEIKGVKVIKDIALGNCDEDSGFDLDKWILCIKDNHKPVLCGKSVFNYTKGLLPIGVDEDRVETIEEQLKLEEKQALEKIFTEDVEMPLGDFSSPGDFTTIQNDFPDTYGISPFGLSDVVPKARKAKAKQLKGYLLFFDQILANYFAHLARAKDLLSVDENLQQLYTVNTIADLSPAEKQTYFSQEVLDIKDFEEIVDTSTYEDTLIDILNKLKNTADKDEDDIYFERRNQLLDHLIGRFAERFSDYAFMMKILYGEAANDEVLKAKARFVEDYKELSCERGLGFNYCDPEVWDTENVSGAQKRIARLNGIVDFSRRNLLSDVVEVYNEIDDDNIAEYRWRIKDGNNILLSSSKHYHTLAAAFDELFLTFKLARDVNNYDVKQTKTGTKTYFNLTNPLVTDTESEAWVVCRRIAYTSTEEASIQKRDEIIAFMENLDAEEEGMYLIEHILLRPDTYHSTKTNQRKKTTTSPPPDAPTEVFMPACMDGDCTSCGPLDPYSYRVSVVMPGWTSRFANVDFRAYMEKIIREEIPAHILAKICWIGHIKGLVPDEENDMLNLQEKYKDFLEKLQHKCENHPLNNTQIQEYRDTLEEFKDCLNGVNTIYHTGRLHDCDNDETETEGNKIILGRTNIGNL